MANASHAYAEDAAEERMEGSVSNMQILGAIHGLFAHIKPLAGAAAGPVQRGCMHVGAGATHSDAPDCDGDTATAVPKVKRRRAKSKYNDYMSVELTRLKEQLPDLPHRQRFAMAVQSWKDILAAAKAEEANEDADEEAEDEGAAEEAGEATDAEADDGTEADDATEAEATEDEATEAEVGEADKETEAKEEVISIP